MPREPISAYYGAVVLAGAVVNGWEPMYALLTGFVVFAVHQLYARRKAFVAARERRQQVETIGTGGES